MKGCKCTPHIRSYDCYSLICIHNSKQYDKNKMNKKSMPSPEKENSLESVVAEDIPATISKYSQQGIFIEILADGYKLEDVGICWRGYVSWNENNTWVKEDCGCYPDWIDAFNSSVEFIHNWVLYKRTLKD